MKRHLLTSGLVLLLGSGSAFALAALQIDAPSGTLAAGTRLAEMDDREQAERHQRGGADDGPGHDAGDDHGRGGHGADDGPDHDAGDDHGSGGHGADDGPGHDVGDDHGEHGEHGHGEGGEGEGGDD